MWFMKWKKQPDPKFSCKMPDFRLWLGRQLLHKIMMWQRFQHVTRGWFASYCTHVSLIQNEKLPSNTGKKYRPDYMEDAIAKYLTLCQAPEFAVRYFTKTDIVIVGHGHFFPQGNTIWRVVSETAGNVHRGSHQLHQDDQWALWLEICSASGTGSLLFPPGTACQHSKVWFPHRPCWVQVFKDRGLQASRC